MKKLRATYRRDDASGRTIWHTAARERLREWISDFERRGGKRKDLAVDFRVTVQAISTWLMGVRRPAIETMVRVARRTGIEPEEWSTGHTRATVGDSAACCSPSGQDGLASEIEAAVERVAELQLRWAMRR